MPTIAGHAREKARRCGREIAGGTQRRYTARDAPHSLPRGDPRVGYLDGVLDTLTLRVALTAVAVTLLTLALVHDTRRPRSHYVVMWTLSMLAAGVSTALFMLNDTPLQALGVVAGNAIAVAGAMLAWGAGHALRGLSTPVVPAIVSAAAVGIITAIDHPGDDVWAAGWALLSGVASGFGLAAYELLALRRSVRAHPDPTVSRDAARAIATLAFGVVLLCVFYWWRFVLYLAVGPFSDFFTAVAGAIPTTIVIIIALVVVTFTMTSLAQIEQTMDLRIRAARDPLTGLRNRTSFEEHANALRRLRRGQPRAAVVADLDHFKAINDEYGHATGDDVLRAFAASVKRVLHSDEAAGRLGGEEFALLLDTADTGIARARLEDLSAHYADAARTVISGTPTVSYGIAVLSRGESLRQALRRADEAMYRAKHAGRDQVAVDDSHVGLDGERQARP